MRSRRGLRNVGTLCLGALLFAHVAVALAACDLVSRSRLDALAVAAQESVWAPCHELQGNLNLCIAHCQGEDLSLDKAQIHVHVLVSSFAFKSRATLAARGKPGAAARATGAWAAPPPRILFQSFLI